MHISSLASCGWCLHLSFVYPDMIIGFDSFSLHDLLCYWDNSFINVVHK
jgi:hypothetical protein